MADFLQSKPIWKQLEPYLVRLGVDFAHLEVNLGVLVAVLPPNWPVLGPDGRQLGPTWTNLNGLGLNLELA